MTAAFAYKQTSVSSSSAPQIMVTLFRAAMGHMRASAGAFDRGELTKGSELAEKAANIVLGLQGTLKAEVAPELCERLSELYIFIAGRLGEAGTKLSAEPVREAEQVFSPIAEAFIQVGNGAAQGAAGAVR
jgi:flagellar biosynthetic protein FliS